MRKLVIGSSSFSNPQNKAWNSLKRKFEIEFLEYGDLGSITDKRLSSDAMVYIQYLDDALTDNKTDFTIEKAKEFLSHVLFLVETRCQESSEAFLFVFSCWKPNDVIRYARKVAERRKINVWFLSELEKLASNNHSFYFLDLDACFSDIGSTKCFDARNWYFAHARLSSIGLEILADAINAILMRHKQAARKVLVLDCDNTLWGGVVGEDGISGLELGTDGRGQAFVDFQKAIFRLKQEGVLLALASKNNEEDVWDVFENHKSMVLSRSDIVASKINWRDKSMNIDELSEELDLDVSSFVFWDDSPIEREKARLALPSMHTVDVSADVWEWPSSIETLWELSKFNVTQDDQEKTSQYMARQKFLTSKKYSLDEVSFLKRIELCAKLIPLEKNNSLRAVQLCQKTNQFNLTTRRHSAEHLRSIAAKNPHFCSLVSLQDKFANHGLVGLFCLQNLNDEDLYIDTFLISCRVLGRQFEAWMMSKIIEIALANGFTGLIAEFIPSNKNKAAEGFLESCGFSKLIGTLPPVGLKSADEFRSNDNFYSRNLTKLQNLDETLYGN